MRWFKRLLLGLMVSLAGTPAAAEWHTARSEHFVIYADQPAQELRDFAQRLERFDHAARKVMRLKDPPLTDSSRLTVYVVNTVAAIEKLAGGYGVAGFYLPRSSGSIAFVPKRAGSKKQKWDLDAEAIFFHEYAHHLQLQQSDLALPSWVTEGFAEFFGPTELRDDGSVVLGVPPAYRAENLFNYSDLSLEEMLGADTGIDGFEYSLTYGRGWLLTHYLTFSAARRGQLDRYVTRIQQGVPPIDAARAAFGDLNVLNKELYGYLRQKKLPHLILASSQLNTGAVSIGPLTVGEAAVMNVHMQSKRGINRKTAGALASEARKIAARFPNDPFVQTALAEAEFDAGNFEAADAAAGSAIAADPKRLSALLLKGRAQMELAKKAPAKADWSEIRSWFRKANKVDPESAEALLQFYNSYALAGARPTPNAIEGLLYALALAPQDYRLRMTVVQQLLVDNRMQEARRHFAPIGFQPHFNKKWREASRKMMSALDLGDRVQALTHLQRLQELALGHD